MHIQMKKCLPNWINYSLIVFLGLLLTGCHSTRSTLPTGGPSMAQIYKDALAESDGGSMDAIRQQIKTPVVFTGKEQLTAYTRTAQNEINQLFPELPNPQMTFYVFPHLVEEGAPVPGYTTAFRLYDTDYYALPGEV